MERYGKLLAAASLLLLSASTAFTNTAPVKSIGKTIQPLNNVPVRMVSEDVKIWLSSTKAEVDCQFTLRNEGKPDTIEVGFPRGWEGDLINFMAKNAKVSGAYSVETLAEQASFGEYNGEKLPWWKVFKVPFESTGQTVVIENHYSTFLLPWGKYPVPMNDLLFTYIIKTGALWKGQIDSAKVTLYLRNVPFDQVTKISPEGYVLQGNRITWNFRNFKPAQNIEISIMQDAFYERLSIARKLLEMGPDSAYAHYLLGTVYFNQRYMDDKQTIEAEKELQKAISLDPKLWDAQWFLALANIYKYRTSKSLKAAKTQFDVILQGNPDYICKDKLFYPDEYMGSGNPKELLKSLEMNNWK